MSATMPTDHEVRLEVEAALDDDEYEIHGIVPSGYSEYLHYYLVVWSQPHSEIEDGWLRQIRYFQIPRKPDETPDLESSFKKNGIAIRDDPSHEVDVKDRLFEAVHDMIVSEREE